MAQADSEEQPFHSGRNSDLRWLANSVLWLSQRRMQSKWAMTVPSAQKAAVLVTTGLSPQWESPERCARRQKGTPSASVAPMPDKSVLQQTSACDGGTEVLSEQPSDKQPVAVGWILMCQDPQSHNIRTIVDGPVGKGGKALWQPSGSDQLGNSQKPGTVCVMALSSSPKRVIYVGYPRRNPEAPSVCCEKREETLSAVLV